MAMRNLRVKIYERLKIEGNWTTVPVAVPKLHKKDGKPFLHDEGESLPDL